MLHTTKKFEKDNAIYFECVFRAIDGTLTDPTGATWTVKDIKGATIETGEALKREDGVWYCFHTPTTVGDYILIFTGTIDTNTVTIRKKFKVVEVRLK